MMANANRVHYFTEGKADPRDLYLEACISQGYVPSGCLLVGQLVWALVNDGKDPCAGCAGPREICGGREKEGK